MLNSYHIFIGVRNESTAKYIHGLGHSDAINQAMGTNALFSGGKCIRALSSGSGNCTLANCY
ncbi:hypothetical protein VCRA2119O147_50055 [Vibrio crassostreae]|nr:hypothetical protein VCRA2118O144_140018 [Vibrio crassostreae]CAK1757816.1 hypothetical protein VCRA2119O145_140074 [Vibrio crassostreae]CAK2376127.1 hypothetical protein VCRA2119O147_50055 [Vibrio crassostreae]CAK2386548.1 hypothetical protein VCRA2117O142_70018 [Vibrio crassostreae]CAK2386577.1 hypothetical protein VCRA2117O143_70017 [Vibrio crassostreae]